MVRIELVREALEPLPTRNDFTDTGTELVFHGIVRSEEEGQTIRGLFYEAYEDMARQELETLAQAAIAKFKIDEVECWHRLDEIPVGETSLRLIVRSKHRIASLDATAWYISELKKHVPIWKWAVLPNGDRIPSHCSDH